VQSTEHVNKPQPAFLPRPREALSGGTASRAATEVFDDEAGTRAERRLTGVLTSTGVATAVSLVVVFAARRAFAPVNRITMGPGGWVSVKASSGAVTSVRGLRRRCRDRGRPWWARLINADRIS
jgi:hypothetical protein